MNHFSYFKFILITLVFLVFSFKLFSQIRSNKPNEKSNKLFPLFAKKHNYEGDEIFYYPMGRITIDVRKLKFIAIGFGKMRTDAEGPVAPKSIGWFSEIEYRWDDNKFKNVYTGKLGAEVSLLVLIFGGEIKYSTNWDIMQTYGRAYIGFSLGGFLILLLVKIFPLGMIKHHPAWFLKRLPNSHAILI